MKITDENLPQNVDLSLFSNNRPKELELGMGRAYFLFERAKAVVDIDVIGIEWKVQWVRQACIKKEREQIANAYPVYGNAWVLVPAIPDGSLSAVMLNFPDPWWKKRHHKRRILNERFLDMLVQKMQPGALFYLQTDVTELFEIYLDLLKSHSRLKEVSQEENPVDNPMQARSHRERKCIENGVPFYRVILKVL